MLRHQHHSLHSPKSLSHLLKAAVIAAAYAPFPTTLFPSCQLSINMLQYGTQRAASLFTNELLRFILYVQSVGDQHLDSCGCVCSTRLGDKENYSAWIVIYSN